MMRKIAPMIRVYDTDDVIDCAKKIYEHFEVNQSCSIFGFVRADGKIELVPKGELVIEQLKIMDETEHFMERHGKRVRKYKFRNNSVGGPIAHKIFVFDKRIVDKEPRITIWRVQ